MGQLEGKVALVTGAGRGIGRSIGLLFAREGANVAVVSRTASSVDTVVDQIKSAGGAAIGVPCDVSIREQVFASVEATVKAFGTIDVLVNCAHAERQQRKLFVETSEADFQQQFASGLFGTVHFMQACYPYLKAGRGKVINFGSGAGINGGQRFAAYAAAKESIRVVTRVAAREWGADKINVNAICPLSMTETLQSAIQQHPQVLAALSQSPLGVPGNPDEEIAPVALFLATEASKFITGYTFMVDGGNEIDAAR